MIDANTRQANRTTTQRKRMVEGNSLLRVYVAENSQLLARLVHACLFLPFSPVKTRELSGTFFRDAA